MLTTAGWKGLQIRLGLCLGLNIQNADVDLIDVSQTVTRTP